MQLMSSQSEGWSKRVSHSPWPELDFSLLFHSCDCSGWNKWSIRSSANPYRSTWKALFGAQAVLRVSSTHAPGHPTMTSPADIAQKNRALFFTVYTVYRIPGEVSSIKIARIVEEGKGGVPIGSEQVQVETFRMDRPFKNSRQPGNSNVRRPGLWTSGCCAMICFGIAEVLLANPGGCERRAVPSESKQTGKRTNIEQIHYSLWFESSCSNHSRSKKGSVIYSCQSQSSWVFPNITARVLDRHCTALWQLLLRVCAERYWQGVLKFLGVGT